jgi:hypothetical protein
MFESGRHRVPAGHRRYAHCAATRLSLWRLAPRRARTDIRLTWPRTRRRYEIAPMTRASNSHAIRFGQLATSLSAGSRGPAPRLGFHEISGRWLRCLRRPR